MAASLVPYSGSDSSDSEQDDVKRQRTELPPDGFFSLGVPAASDSDEEDYTAAAAGADEVPAADAVQAAVGVSVLPSVTELLESTGRPAWLDLPGGGLSHQHGPSAGAAERTPVSSTLGSAPVKYSAEEAARRAELTALRQELNATEAHPSAPRDRARAASHAMPVAEALANAAAALPRKQQDRRDREKNKRERGQSSISTWKTEAEMVLRQQYD